MLTAIYYLSRYNY
ncbi:uncharacterized protein FFNC_15117 [Fusarium fujikuroi]|nr:uncharacterized protein FFE2_15209 [Fusarium fujikuroi]SCO53675.1 uncharacterized protein FFNC_15117 [Fusarium fujikuroi]SCV60634.1 uncharacterized protein FFFS_15203 [Fusarium fujikuroi]